MKVLITGASGLIGRELVRELSRRGDEIVMVRRKNSAISTPFATVTWDTKSGDVEGNLTDLDAVVHLAGAGIGSHRWNGAVKDDIYYSRVQGTRQIVNAIDRTQSKPVRFLGASAIGYYGDRGDELLDESSPGGSNFLARVVKDWEKQSLGAEKSGHSVALFRTGIVLSGNGGALKKQLPLFKLGLGGKLGSGRQWNSWIHISDEVRAISFLLDHPEITGPVNLVSPSPITNAKFTETLANVLSRPSVLRIPRLALNAALGTEMASELLLSSARVRPKVLSEAGFSFNFSHLDHCLWDLIWK